MSSSRERMLASIRASLDRSRAALAAEAAGTTHVPPQFVHPPQDDLPAQFVAELERLEGRAHRCADDEEALEAIRGLIERCGATSAVAWGHDQIGLPSLATLLDDLGVQLLDGDIRAADDRGLQLQALEPAPICLSGADAAIAESGTLVLRSGPGRGRLASLLAPIHIAVLRADQIARGLGEALDLIQRRHGPDIFAESSNLTLISGPSRTGDIEQTLVLGAHGPRELHVVLIG